MNSSRDNNYVSAKMGVLNTDGKTLVPIKINPANGAMKINQTDTISFTMTPIAEIDDNFNKTLLFEGTDGKTYPWVCNASGEVLIDP